MKLSRHVPLCMSSSADPCHSVRRKVLVRDLRDDHFDDSLRSYVRDLHDLQKLYTKHMPIPFYDPRQDYDQEQVKRNYDAFVAATS